MSFLLDSDICSAGLKGDSRIAGKFLQYTGQLHVSVITVGELLTWAFRRKASPRRLHNVETLLQGFTALPVTWAVAHTFGKIRAPLMDIGRPTGELDLLIAATALVNDLTLVTHNQRDFADVPDLPVADWLEG